MKDTANSSGGKQGFVHVLIFSLLIFLTVLVYSHVGTFDFISMDDPVYVTDNPYVNQGVTLKGVTWAVDFGHDSGPYWMPMTMLSHMMDCRLFGLDPGRHHLHNLILHLINTALLFLFFYKTTGCFGKSLFISALFALHPLNVESVAWVTSRKNLLSTLFLLLALLAYHGYVLKKNLNRYLLVLLFYVLALASKASVITLIFSFLLFDLWPFHRFLLFREGDALNFRIFDRRNIAPVFEKIPLIIVTGLILYLNFSKASFVNEATTTESVGMGLRAANALTAYVTYMIQSVWPISLSVHYPYPAYVSLWKSVPAATALVCVSVYALYSLKRRPYLAVGWFFFTGNLVMVSGVIQGGLWPAHADRFMYVPAVGLFLILAYLFNEKFKGIHAWALGIAFCLGMAQLAHMRSWDWKDSVTLFTQAVQADPSDMVSTVNLAFALDKAGKTEEALPYYETIVSKHPGYAEVHANMAVIFAGKGEDEKALLHFNEAVKGPKPVTAYINKARFHAGRNEDAAAEESFRKVLDLEPGHLEALQGLSGLLIKKKDYDKARLLYENALIQAPEAGLSIRYNLACVYAMSNEREKSLKTLQDIVADGFRRFDVMKADPQLESLKGMDEFKKMVGE